MDRDKLDAVLLEGLLELEVSDDIVITHSIPSSLAKRISSHLLQAWVGEFCQSIPFELHIHDSLMATANIVHREFDISESDAQSIVEQFHTELLQERTLREFSELVWHQGNHELAAGAYYCVVLRRGKYYSRDYLDWRTDYYASRKS